MNRKRKITCSQARILGNGIMAAGFFVFFAAAGLQGTAGEGGREAAAAVMAGVGLLAAGGAEKFLLWRCPKCRCHLMLCARGRIKTCPCCGTELSEK